MEKNVNTTYLPTTCSIEDSIRKYNRTIYHKTRDY